MLQAALTQQAVPECRYDSLPTAYQSYDDWQGSLLDPIYKLEPFYQPPDLVPVSQAGFPSDHLVRQILIEDLRTLRQAALAAGHALVVLSAYRSYEYQERTFNYWLERLGETAALKSSARAGHSEHQLGTAVDFGTAGAAASWDMDDWAQTPAGAWLRENAWQYGFIMSYPKGQTAVTCYIYEPWHYRYMGSELTQAILESGLSLREWLWQQQ